jgi:hypothetical protein
MTTRTTSNNNNKDSSNSSFKNTLTSNHDPKYVPRDTEEMAEIIFRITTARQHSQTPTTSSH